MTLFSDTIILKSEIISVRLTLRARHELWVVVACGADDGAGRPRGDRGGGHVCDVSELMGATAGWRTVVAAPSPPPHCESGYFFLFFFTL